MNLLNRLINSLLDLIVLRGWIVKQALTSWVALEAKRHQLTLEGMADVDAGRLVDHASIDAWATSLDKSA